ncbi:hypothetical protein GCM10007977_026590 [Dactylosporangium sucinum]|uniref:Uncharacterized protein n=1 Tax=Dactylosporangium sucinum TaxID=1424081 RepID=A0A917TIH3_9ACTN|nr:hypothetical protein GCM10007977_026590 [Dactylosporangium sucinum]
MGLTPGQRPEYGRGAASKSAGVGLMPAPAAAPGPAAAAKLPTEGARDNRGGAERGQPRGFNPCLKGRTTRSSWRRSVPTEDPIGCTRRVRCNAGQERAWSGSGGRACRHPLL